MADPVATFERFLAADRQARSGPPEIRAAAKAHADYLFRCWQAFPRDVRQRVEEHFKPGCTPAGATPALPDDVDPTLRDLVEAAYAHPYDTPEHHRAWLVALDYEQEHCPTDARDYVLLRQVAERLLARLAR